MFSGVFWELAIDQGIRTGFHDKGTVYVYAGGNDHRFGSHVNTSELTNYYGVVTVCAVGADGRRAAYSETGASLWVYAPAASVTTANGSRYREDFSATSAATPLVTGVVALMRPANPELTWRDVKLILAASARKNDPESTGWQDVAVKYGAESETDRYSFNHEYGFGVVDATAAVALAEEWINLPPMRTASASSPDASTTIPNPAPGATPTTVTSTID